MLDIHYQILKYFSENPNPVDIRKLPNEITSELENDVNEGSLHHEMHIILSGQKKWVKSEPGSMYHFSISDFGKEAYGKEFDKRGHDWINQKLTKENADLNRQLTEAQITLTKLQIKETKRRNIYAIVAFIMGALVGNVRDILDLLRKVFHK